MAGQWRPDILDALGVCSWEVIYQRAWAKVQARNREPKTTRDERSRREYTEAHEPQTALNKPRHEDGDEEAKAGAVMINQKLAGSNDDVEMAEPESTSAGDTATAAKQQPAITNDPVAVVNHKLASLYIQV